jgi:pyruvate/2-oxoglutarate dehydrogenase complex dihydrolipoamide acyltransferase (E2) component
VRTRGLEAVAGQECGNGVVIDHGDGWETQYCHVARGSVRVKVGDVVKAGTPIARVGLSGQTEFPHLHLTVRHAGQVVDPFAPGAQSATSCAPQASMWTPAAARALAYKAGVILNAGLAGAPVTSEAVEAGGIAPPTAASPAIVAYMRVAEPQQGDELEITLRGPDGATLASQRLPPLDRDKAQYFAMIGRKRPPSGWKPGRYSAELRVWRGGKVALQRAIATAL